MISAKIINLIFIILGLTGAFYGLYSILLRNIKRNIHEEIGRMENDLLKKIKSGNSNVAG
jgi:hypothetical protein